MEKQKKRLILASIFMIIYLIIEPILLASLDKLISNNTEDNITNLIFYILSIIGIIYFFILAFKKNIDLKKHYKGIMACSIVFFIGNIVSGVLGFMLYSDLDRKGKKKEKRQLPIIEDKEFTNKWVCLIAFLICMFIMINKKPRISVANNTI